jgi:hypothetical protein
LGIRQAQADLVSQQTALTNQYAKELQIQRQLATAETNIVKQNEKIGTVESLVTNLYSRSVIETLDIRMTYERTLLRFNDRLQLVIDFNVTIERPNFIFESKLGKGHWWSVFGHNNKTFLIWNISDN